MFFTLKKFEKKFCNLETSRWGVCGYINKVGFQVLEFAYYTKDGVLAETLFIPLSEIKSIGNSGPEFMKFMSNVMQKSYKLDAIKVDSLEKNNIKEKNSKNKESSDNLNLFSLLKLSSKAIIEWLSK
jgi:hypothetical protein